MTQTSFQVDLHGLVELLSRNLYSGPRVFVRELLQNGVDAITARRGIDPECPATIIFELDERAKTLMITDSGVGLTLDEATQLLSTIGASSKRDELGMARTDYLGQFGIGLLSGFMVSEDITVLSRSARSEGAKTIEWVGRATGTWQAKLAETQLEQPGTRFILHALPGLKLFEPATLAQLIEEYGRFLDVEVRLRAPGREELTLSRQQVPWQMTRLEQEHWCAKSFGFHPFDAIPLEVPQAGFKGTGFVLPSGTHPGQSLRHHVYLRRMMLSTRVTQLLPDWAYFVRVVGDAQFLNPTASREDIFDDDLLEETRQEIGAQIRNWLSNLATEEPAKFSSFVEAHMTGLKSLALTDRATRDLVAETVPIHTSLGVSTINRVLELEGRIRYTRTNDHFRSLKDVAEAAEVCIVNAGFAFDEELLGLIILDRPDVDIALVDPEEILSHLHVPAPDIAMQYAELKRVASSALYDQGIDVDFRSFEPARLPVLFLPDPDFAGQMVADSARVQASGVWEELLGVVDPFADSKRPRLVLNTNAEIINRLSGARDHVIVTAAVRGLYVQSLLSGHHPMNPQARAWSTDLYTTLIEASLKG
ncbi:MAG: HSP90 family protein [Actinomycetaceae bacterium]|nr:HSP90 family protein [Actinomycetaceae bacterium]